MDDQVWTESAQGFDVLLTFHEHRQFDRCFLVRLLRDKDSAPKGPPGGLPDLGKAPGVPAETTPSSRKEGSMSSETALTLTLAMHILCIRRCMCIE